MTSSASQQASRGVPPPLDSPRSAPPGGRSRTRSQRPPRRHCAPLAGLALRAHHGRALARPGAPCAPLAGLALRRPISRLPTRNMGSCALARSLALRVPRTAPFGAPVTTLRARRAGLPTRAVARVWGGVPPNPPKIAKPQVNGIITRVQGRPEPYGHVSAGQSRVQGSGFGTPRGGGRRKPPPRADPRFRHPPIARTRALCHLIKRPGQGKGGTG